MVVIFQIVHETELDQNILQPALRHGRRYGEILIFYNGLGKTLILVGLFGVRRIFYDGFAIYLCPLNDIVSGHVVQQLCAELLGKGAEQIQLPVHISAVADNAADAGAAGTGVAVAGTGVTLTSLVGDGTGVAVGPSISTEDTEKK